MKLQPEQGVRQSARQTDFVIGGIGTDKKPYSVRVVRAEHDHYFYPDFVVWFSHETR